MRIEKKTLNDALRVLGKVVCQTSPVELYRSIRFVGDGDRIMAMATDGVETVSMATDAFTDAEIDFCVPFKELKDLVRMGRSETIELNGTFIEFPEQEEPSAEAVSAILPENFGELLTQAAPIVDRTGYRRVLHGINLSHAGVTTTDGKQLLHLPCVLSLAPVLPTTLNLQFFFDVRHRNTQLFRKFFCRLRLLFTQINQVL